MSLRGRGDDTRNQAVVWLVPLAEASAAWWFSETGASPETLEADR